MWLDRERLIFWLKSELIIIIFVKKNDEII